MRWAGRCGDRPLGEVKRCCCRRGEHRPQNTANETGGRPMAAPTGATLPLPSKKKNFHLIRPVCALGTFPSRGRLAKAFLFLALWFFDSLKKQPLPNGSGCFARGGKGTRRVEANLSGASHPGRKSRKCNTGGKDLRRRKPIEAFSGTAIDEMLNALNISI